jgi:hypothetical protein
MNETKKFICSLCGKAHDSVIDRANCELTCARRQAEEAKKAAETKKKEEQATRKAAVDKARAEYLKLKQAYIKDYGVYEIPVTFVSDEEEYRTWVEEILHNICE